MLAMLICTQNNKVLSKEASHKTIRINGRYLLKKESLKDVIKISSFKEVIKKQRI